MRLDLDYRAAEHGGRSAKTPRHRPLLAEGGRNDVKKRTIKWLTPFLTARFQTPSGVWVRSLHRPDVVAECAR